MNSDYLSPRIQALAQQIMLHTIRPTLAYSRIPRNVQTIYLDEKQLRALRLFFESDEVCEVSNQDLGGRYQRQLGVTLPKA